ncbi:MAG TPA: F0F1 ATP synthase subunit delta [Burkholderiaceae bacterium]|nr:F0F1 ATP synthase subunit delta [Burkholderiaceae bacterium]
MAELSTIARPYAQALFESARADGTLATWLEIADELATVTAHPRVAEVVADPKLGAPQIFDLLSGLMKTKLTASGANFLRTMIDNGRLAAMPEVAQQLHALKNAADGVADCTIETAFPLDDAQVNGLVAALAKRFGLKLNPEVKVNPDLIGGVRVAVGDHVLDTSVRSRLQAMKAALTAA